jgi:hypothetical protein
MWKSRCLITLWVSTVCYRVRVTLRLAVYRQLVHLGETPWDSTTSNFFQLNTCGHSPYELSSLMRGWVYRLQLLLALASTVILRSESRETHDHILLSQIWDPQPGGPGPRIYIPQEQGGPVIPTGTGIPFRRLLQIASGTYLPSCCLGTAVSSGSTIPAFRRHVTLLPP